MARVEIFSRIVGCIVVETQSRPVEVCPQLKTRHYQQKVVDTVELPLHVCYLKPINCTRYGYFKVLLLVAIVQLSLIDLQVEFYL